jgi:hypothetical protein
MLADRTLGVATLGKLLQVCYISDSSIPKVSNLISSQKLHRPFLLTRMKSKQIRTNVTIGDSAQGVQLKHS